MPCTSTDIYYWIIRDETWSVQSLLSSTHAEADLQGGCVYDANYEGFFFFWRAMEGERVVHNRRPITRITSDTSEASTSSSKIMTCAWKQRRRVRNIYYFYYLRIDSYTPRASRRRFRLEIRQLKSFPLSRPPAYNRKQLIRRVYIYRSTVHDSRKQFHLSARGIRREPTRGRGDGVERAIMCTADAEVDELLLRGTERH